MARYRLRFVLQEFDLPRGVTVIAGGAKGSALQGADSSVLAYWAPGNLYAQRGTAPWPACSAELSDS